MSATDHVNEVRLIGRVSQPPEIRTLPSGDEGVAFRLVVARPKWAGRQEVDAFECVAWAPRPQRSAKGWHVDDVVEVTGSLRRRFFRNSEGASSRIEVDVNAGRIVKRGKA